MHGDDTECTPIFCATASAEGHALVGAVIGAGIGGLVGAIWGGARGHRDVFEFVAVAEREEEPAPAAPDAGDDRDR
jgi:hypothetical protein